MGDRTMSLAEKYDTTRTWEEPCAVCGEPVVMRVACVRVQGRAPGGVSY